MKGHIRTANAVTGMLVVAVLGLIMGSVAERGHNVPGPEINLYGPEGCDAVDFFKASSDGRYLVVMTCDLPADSAIEVVE